ncbi:SCO2400 family protein, partial [Streptomyces ipomoeae]
MDDYCHPCRRHLNGALACPGCGTSVEELRAYADEGDARPEDAEDTSAASEDEPGRRSSRRRAARERGGSAGARSSRRDRKAAAHRRRRKRILLIGSGLLLAVGALSLAELGMEAPHSGTTNQASDEEPTEGAASPDGAADAEDGTTEGSAEKDSPSASPSDSPSPSASETEKDDKDEDEKKKDRDEQSATAGTRPDT